VVRHQIRSGRGDQGAKLFDERERVEEDGTGPVLEGVTEAIPNPAVREALEALDRYGGSGHVPDQSFQLLPPPPMDAHVGMERETIGLRAAIPGKLDEADARHPSFPLDVGPSFTAQTHHALHRSRVAPTQHRRAEGESILVQGRVLGKMALLHEQAQDLVPDFPGQLVHLVVFQVAEGMEGRCVLAGRHGVNAVKQQGMEMGVQIDGSPEPLGQLLDPILSMVSNDLGSMKEP